MTLNELNLAYSYDKAYCDVAEEFYLPCMKNSILYYRTTGYFSSGVFLIAWDALQEFIDANGKIRIICSPILSPEDIGAIEEGLTAQTDEILSKSILSELNTLLNSEHIIPAKLLSCLIAQEILEIKFAVMENAIFHDKVGIFGDELGDFVGFRGTMNETYKGLASDGNSESVDVYTSFSESKGDRERTKKALSAFMNLWDNNIPTIKVYDLPTGVKEHIFEIAKNENFDELLYSVVKKEKREDTHRRDTRVLRPHQEKALDNWYALGRRGILEHATGSGKTFTAICAIRDSLLRKEIPFVLVPSTSLLQQWKKELEFALQDLNPTIYPCGDNHTGWKKNLSIISKYYPKSSQSLIILSVMATASTKEFISKFSGGDHIFLVADEAHRLGSPNYRNIFSIQSGARLALSATPKRYGDPEGTYAIYSYFENTLDPKYTLYDAISDGVLTEYKYSPSLVSLTAEEQDEWNELTKKIKRRSAILKNSSKETGSHLGDPSLKKWLLARARILKNASEKIPAAVKVIEDNYKQGDKWIVYCDNIDEQMRILTDKLSSRYPVLEYHSRLTQEERDAIMKQFDMNGGILVSVKCLDEGVDIPSVSHALIIASSKNPREFIQRRGRVLRKYPGKALAYLFDLLVLPFATGDDPENDSTLSIIEGELARAIQFGKESPYPKSVIDLYNIAVDYNINPDNLLNSGYDDDED